MKLTIVRKSEEKYCQDSKGNWSSSRYMAIHLQKWGVLNIVLGTIFLGLSLFLPSTILGEAGGVTLAIYAYVAGALMITIAWGGKNKAKQIDTNKLTEMMGKITDKK